MSRRARHAKQSHGRRSVWSWLSRWLPARRAALPLGVIACCLAALFAWGAGSAAAATSPAYPKGPPVTNFTKHPWCGEAGLPACPAAEPGWIPLAGTTPGAVAATLARSNAFKMINARHGGVALDLPALVHTLAAPSGYDYFDDDHWVVSVRDGRNQQVGMYDFVYDRANQRVRFAAYGALTPKDARFGHAFPHIPASTAVDRLQAERHLNAKDGVQPELVFFHFDDQAIGPRAAHPWTAGGGSPLDAMWRVTGTDGIHYYVGQDLHVYDRASLPIQAAKA